jgi:NADPH-dependent 7-cyano-7-deazaguanine reductase QueF
MTYNNKNNKGNKENVKFEVHLALCLCPFTRGR